MRSLPSSARGRTGTACTAWATPANLAFNHEGATILAYLPSGNPLTLESIVYGLSAAVMMASVILWFSCYNAVMTSDKFAYLFGRVIPALIRKYGSLENARALPLQTWTKLPACWTGSGIQRRASCWIPGI